jgi:hypothetical protein
MNGLFVIGGLLGVLAISYIGLNRPSVNNRSGDPESSEEKSLGQGAYLWLCWLPLVTSAFLLTIYWAWYLTIHPDGLGLIYFLGFGIALNLLGFLFWAVLSRSSTKNKLREFVMVVIGGAVGGCLMYLASTASFFVSEGKIEMETYTTFAVPLLLSTFVLSAILFNGLISFWTTDSDREWWSRSDAWILIAVFGWVAISALVIFGPIGLGRLEAYAASVGGLSGLITILLGRSPDTASNESQKEKEKASWPVRLKKFALKLAAPIFAVFLLILIALVVTILIELLDGSAFAKWLSDRFSLGLNLNLESDPLPAGLHDKYNHLAVIYRTPLWLVVGIAVVLVLVSCGMALFVNINRFSLHSMYRNRLIRAYLGASNPDRKPNKFTGFDPRDNIRMHKLWPKTQADKQRTKLFHVINMALNLVHGENLAWQERKAESFTASPLHAGNYSVGYRSSEHYGGRGGGISLGTALAISGAAASPNMGYNSSTFITFLMTLFNARLGWWLGNPGPAGNGTYYLEGPYFALKPLIAETLGLTDDKNDYVYLSDGGHFENLGLYEMVLRRCHFIVVSDGSQDDEATFSSLGNAVRKIRIDLGIPIDFNDPMCIYSRNPERKGKYCAIGKIRYSCVDGAGTDGILVYIKPAFYGDEPRDIFEYARANSLFPHESTADQFFTESQFESYRMLGSYIMEQLCPEGSMSQELNDFLSSCVKYLYPDALPSAHVSKTPDWLNEWLNPKGGQAP